MKPTQHLLVALAAFFVVGLAVPLPGDVILDAPYKAKPYKTEVDQQAAVKRDDTLIDAPDAQKPYKDEVDQHAAAKRDDIRAR
ncbi:Uu.00g087040.m01.CDS01 [Anthostomella pinea]|uniref:Uu.00g087040.m01.CDS01 n=1 Tax=Anthostomella pinea TaxID=933095 RepID=A0AAI8YK32_9PEZI|nr:Uu.00g087040.m01.CDS01 [Anthostomella pinea]